MSLSDKSNILQQKIKNLPGKPGVYQYFDKEGTIIYVGKAKNLKKRVTSYFTGDRKASGKVKMLVRRIIDLHVIVVDSETDALLLENNLIKKHQPKYNIQLKDDKTYPWICIKKEPFPRIFSTRNVIRDGSDYYGPYASVKMMNTLLELVRQLYPLRNCKLRLDQLNIAAGKFKVCLEYHIGNCLAPCVGKQSQSDYLKNIEQIRHIIKGNISQVLRQLKSLMQEFAANMDFEKAQEIKDKIEILERYQSKSTVVSPGIHDADVFSILEDGNEAFVNYLKIIDGAIVQAHTVELKKKLDEDKESLLLHAMLDIREKLHSTADEIILPFLPRNPLPGVKYTLPKIGDKKQLLELSERNLKYYKLEKDKQRALVDPERHSRRVLERLQKDLRMNVLPKQIECFDNSNFQGAYPVAAMVMFKDAKPYKKGYRHYLIKEVEGPNDFASMEEVIYRRYKRLLDEEKELPQLIIVDGGKGQLSAAVKSLDKLGLRGKITIIGIAKRLEEIYFPGDSIPLYIDKASESLRTIQFLRDEAHRFGITHHRSRRDKGTLKTELTSIKGIGAQTAELLLKKFRSLKKIREASEKEIAAVSGPAKAHIIWEHFKKNEA